jgi:transposase-like protein
MEGEVMVCDKVPREKKLQAVLLAASQPQLTDDEVAKVIGINKRTFQRAKKNFKEHASVEAVPKKRGPKEQLHINMKLVNLSSFFVNIFVVAYQDGPRST